MKIIKIKKDKEKSIRKMHPWIYSGAILPADNSIENGDVVKIESSTGDFIAYGFYSSKSKISVRVLSWNKEDIIDDDFFIKRIKSAVKYRDEHIVKSDTNCYRYVYSESDFLPGLIVDKFDEYLSIAFNSAGIYKIKDLVLKVLTEIFAPKGIYDSSDNSMQDKEGIKRTGGLLSGELPDKFLVKENGINYYIRLQESQKTGFFLDQRENRKIISSYAKDKRVLDTFCYSGGFTLNSLSSGAREVVSIDSSEKALDLLKENIKINDFSDRETTSIHANVFEKLRDLKEKNEKFDLVILDPPKLASSRKHLDKALRAYKDLIFSAISLLNDGGTAVVFSCSQAVSLETLMEVLRWATMDSSKDIRIIGKLMQPLDHPVLSLFPESEYLKGIVFKIV